MLRDGLVDPDAVEQGLAGEPPLDTRIMTIT